MTFQKLLTKGYKNICQESPVYFIRNFNEFFGGKSQKMGPGIVYMLFESS